MKYMTYPSALALTLILAACGGGGSGAAGSGTAAAASTQVSDSSATQNTSAASTSQTAASTSTAPTSTSTPTATTPAPTSTTQLVEYYGDSTIWGYASGIGGQVATPAPLAFAHSLPTSPIKYDVHNEGVSGTTACQLLNGTDGVHPAWDTQMTNSSATYVIVNHAINDEWKYDVATYQSCLHSLARTAKAHGKTIIFETPNPTRDSGSTGLDVYVNAMKTVAGQEQAPVIDQYAYLTAYLNGQSPYTICPDGLHPTDAVYIMKGQYAAQVFANLFPG